MLMETERITSKRTEIFADSRPWVHSLSRRPPFCCQAHFWGSRSPDELNVNFGCNTFQSEVHYKFKLSTGIQSSDSEFLVRSNSFSCLSGAALSANATLANTNMCNGVIGEEILPTLDSPRSFRRMVSSPSLSRLDLASSSSQSSISTLGGSILTDSDMLDHKTIWKPMSAPISVDSTFLTAIDVQMAGGAAGEDRVQAVCSEENGWLFCGVYDGFNGRDAADFLAATLYENIGFYLYLLQSSSNQYKKSIDPYDTLRCSKDGGRIKSELSIALGDSNSNNDLIIGLDSSDKALSTESFRCSVLNCLTLALAQTESDFLYMVEQEMDERPDLVSIGSCVLSVLLHGIDLYILNLGDSRAVLATNSLYNNELQATQLTEIHTVDNQSEYYKVLADHVDDPSAIIDGRVKGKLKLTRAFGVGYLKKSKLNDALMGILRVRNLCSPPYIYTHPFTMSHQVMENDLFIVLGSDGLFDFFDNNEVVGLVYKHIHDNPSGDPAKYLIEQLVYRAAIRAELSTEGLMSIPVGVRRKYHDDVTVIVIILGNSQRTSKASVSM